MNVFGRTHSSTLTRLRSEKSNPEATKGLEFIQALYRVKRDVEYSGTLDSPGYLEMRKTKNREIYERQSAQVTKIPLGSAMAYAIKYRDELGEFPSSSMGETLRYTPTDVLATFPFPQDLNQRQQDLLEQSGRLLNETRRKLMRERELGATELYNFLSEGNNAPSEISELIEVTNSLDTVVFRSYGWQDLTSHSGARNSESLCGQRLRDEVFDRLASLNQNYSQKR